jgi:hypothetical protein
MEGEEREGEGKGTAFAGVRGLVRVVHA